jgi:hypothetical protein
LRDYSPKWQRKRLTGRAWLGLRHAGRRIFSDRAPLQGHGPSMWPNNRRDFGYPGASRNRKLTVCYGLARGRTPARRAVVPRPAMRGRRAKAPPADGRQSLWLRTTSLAWFSAFSGSRDSRRAAPRCFPAAGNSLRGRPGRPRRQTPACGPAFPESAGFHIPCGRSLRDRAPS